MDTVHTPVMSRGSLVVITPEITLLFMEESFSMATGASFTLTWTWSRDVRRAAGSMLYLIWFSATIPANLKFIFWVNVMPPSSL